MIYDDPILYDQLYGRFTDDIPFYRSLAEDAGGECCELACGTGRVGIALAAAGVRVFGVDLNPAMITAARTRSREAGVEGWCEFLEADMREFVRPGRFSLVFVPLHSLSHLLTTVDVDRCFSAVRTGLTDDGVFAFAVHNPDPAVLARQPGALERVPFDADGIAVYEACQYDGASQILSLTWYVETSSETRRFDYRLRMFFPQELELLLDRAGFAIAGRYGWYDRTPLTSDSGTQVIVAQPR